MLTSVLAQRIRDAGRSFTREVLRFRVNYPIESTLVAAQRASLRYYVYSDRLFLDDLEFDAEGIPLKRYRLLGPHHNPLFVAWWGLHHLEQTARDGDHRHHEVFLAQLNWLRTNALVRGDGAVVWPCYFDWQEGRARLRAPWISAMYQGVVMSALVRGTRLTGDDKFLDLALGGTRVFSQDVGSAGVRSHELGGVLYEEYPAFPLPRVLDGFLFSLLGLYDVYAETSDDEVRRLFADGVEGLCHYLDRWNYRGKWSWYGCHGYLCPPHYHALNWALLRLVYGLTGDERLRAMVRAWDPHELTRRDRLEVFLVFALTKNWARLRLPRQRGR